ncbi:MAG: metal ABC transporter ATP-binding protein [Gemmatimonadales bacterium]
MTAHETTAPSALEVEHLSVSFGVTRVLDDLSFGVEAGTSLAIIGPSGAGKTVLFRSLIGAVRAEGTIRFAPGTRIGYVPQKLDIERDLPLTGLDFLHARAHVSRSPATESTRFLELVALDPRIAGQPLGTLSGGQFQRLLVAFALMGRPTVLLFDEPTAGVDEPGEEGIYALFRRLQREEGLTLLIISHELNLVYRYADNVLCLSRWHTCFGPPLEILTPERLQAVYGAPVLYHGHDAHRA